MNLLMSKQCYTCIHINVCALKDDKFRETNSDGECLYHADRSILCNESCNYKKYEYHTVIDNGIILTKTIDDYYTLMRNIRKSITDDITSQIDIR